MEYWNVGILGTSISPHWSHGVLEQWYLKNKSTKRLLRFVAPSTKPKIAFPPYALSLRPYAFL
jgi:hypothetical protein